MNLPLLLLVLGVSHQENHQWENFKLEYKKNYDSLQEEVYRRGIFLNNLKEIERHNQNFEQGFELFSKGVNEYSDLENDEFHKMFLGDIESTG